MEFSQHLLSFVKQQLPTQTCCDPKSITVLNNLKYLTSILLLMEEILHQLRLVVHRVCIHPRWLFGISSINSKKDASKNMVPKIKHAETPIKQNAARLYPMWFRKVTRRPSIRSSPGSTTRNVHPGLRRTTAPKASTLSLQPKKRFTFLFIEKGKFFTVFFSVFFFQWG